MKSFRARSQLLVSRLEDSDEVLHLEFSDENGDLGPDSDDEGYVFKSRCEKISLGFTTQSDINQPVQSQKKARSVKFGI